MATIVGSPKLITQDVDKTIEPKTGSQRGVIRQVWDYTTSLATDEVTGAEAAFPISIGSTYSQNGVTRLGWRCNRIRTSKLGLNTDQPTTQSNFQTTVEFVFQYNFTTTPVTPTANTPFTVSGNMVKGQEALVFDLDGYLVTNSAGDMFPKPIMIETAMPSFTITRNERMNPIDKMMYYSPKYGTVNADPLWGFPPRTLKLTMGVQYSSDSGWNVSYNFEVNTDTWDLFVLDEGANVLNDAGQLVPGSLEGSGTTPTTGTVYLDGYGKQTNVEGAYDLVFQKRIPVSYAALNLPNIGGLF